MKRLTGIEGSIEHSAEKFLFAILKDYNLNYPAVIEIFDKCRAYEDIGFEPEEMQVLCQANVLQHHEINLLQKQLDVATELIRDIHFLMKKQDLPWHSVRLENRILRVFKNRLEREDK